ncbi:MAG: cell division/cell wall cluster transcriptional repressor MraZ [Rhodobacteraceae bacterium]|nr:cell division/cell wall cluster transcriptional repressor MraZ [Paracoccaceae bacterium]
MVQAFTGEAYQKVDAKGRMSIPAPYRRVLETGDPEWTAGRTPKMQVIYGAHLKDALHAYTVEEYDRIVAQINAMPRGDKNRAKLNYLMVTQSATLDVDKDGRIIMPLYMRQKLGIEDGEIYFRGMGDHFEMWKSETFKVEVVDEITEWLREQEEGFDPLSLLGGT